MNINRISIYRCSIIMFYEDDFEISHIPYKKATNVIHRC